MTNQLYLRSYMIFVSWSSFATPKIELLLSTSLLIFMSSRFLVVLQIMWEKPRERNVNNALNMHEVIKTVL